MRRRIGVRAASSHCFTASDHVSEFSVSSVDLLLSDVKS
jgi:hypothetical protein